MAEVDAVVISSHPDNVRRGLLEETEEGKLLTRFCSIGRERSIELMRPNNGVSGVPESKFEKQCELGTVGQK